MKKAGEESPAVEAQYSTQSTIHLMLGPRQAKLSDGCGHFRLARQNEAARAADAAREVNGAVYGERLK
jgi:hypothetical protein